MLHAARRSPLLLLLCLLVASSAAWAYPTTLYTGYAPGQKLFACCAMASLVPLGLLLLLHLSSDDRSGAVVAGSIALMVLCGGVILATWETDVHYPVTALGNGELEVATRASRGVSTRRVPAAEVTCHVTHYESCDSDNENCSTRYHAVLFRAGEPLVPPESREYEHERDADARCDAMAAHGVRRPRPARR